MKKILVFILAAVLLSSVASAGLFNFFDDNNAITGKSIFSKLFARLSGRDVEDKEEQIIKTPGAVDVIPSETDIKERPIAPKIEEGVVPSETDIEQAKKARPPKLDAEIDSMPGTEEAKELEVDIAALRGAMCKDSDGGINYFTFGAATDFSPWYIDDCTEALHECFDICNIRYPDGHVDPACIACMRLYPDWCQPYTVPDTCPGQSSTVIPTQLVEVYCNHDKIDYKLYNCPEACWNGKCVDFDDLSG